MKFSRRAFLELLGGGVLGAVIAPQAALAELTHGASDLTPQERDVVADVMGLRREQWAGWTEPQGGVLVMMPGTTIIGVDSDVRPSFSWTIEVTNPEQGEITIYGQPVQPQNMKDITAAFIRRSTQTVDNLGLTINVEHAAYITALEKYRAQMISGGIDRYALKGV